MVPYTLAEANLKKEIVPGDLLSITTDGEPKQYIYILYNKPSSMHWLFPYPLPKDPALRNIPVFLKEDHITNWEKIGHKETEELEKMLRELDT